MKLPNYYNCPGRTGVSYDGLFNIKKSIWIICFPDNYDMQTERYIGFRIANTPF